MLLNETPPPVVPVPSARRLGPVGVVILIVLLEVPAYWLWTRARRTERELADLKQQALELQREVGQAHTQSEAALGQASQAEANAALAAQQRDQAVQARDQSAQVAAKAQQQAVAATQEATQAQQEAATLRAEREAELDRLQTVLSQIASTRKTGSGLVVTLDSNAIRFDFDKSTIRPGNRETLSRMAGVLMTLQGYHIYVYGFTDNIGTEQYNQKLSERRAAAVRDYLVNAGVDSKIIDTKGYGESDPLEKGDSAQARAKNRRVEIGIVDSFLRMEGVVAPSLPASHN